MLKSMSYNHSIGLSTWISDINCYTSSVIGFIGNALLVLLSLTMRDKEINAYRWIICSQAAIEAADCILTVLMKFEHYKQHESVKAVITGPVAYLPKRMVWLFLFASISSDFLLIFTFVLGFIYRYFKICRNEARAIRGPIGIGISAVMVFIISYRCFALIKGHQLGDKIDVGSHLVTISKALIPVIFDLVPNIFIASSSRFEIPLIASIGELLSPWRDATHPLICFIFVRPLCVTFYNAVKTLLMLHKFVHSNKVSSNVAALS